MTPWSGDPESSRAPDAGGPGSPVPATPATDLPLAEELRAVSERCSRLEGDLACERDRREKAEEELRVSQKLEAIGQLAGGVAHDFNNLLSVIIGRAELMMADRGASGEGGEDVAEILRCAERAASLTRQLLAFSRRQLVERRALNLNDALGEMQKMLRRLIGEDVELEISLSPALGTVLADPGQIDQIILNLAVNARDAMPTGGRLLIETQNVDLDVAATSRHPVMMPGPYVMISVCDTGTGMDTLTKARIFEPFFTTKEPGKGTGLGLSTVYGIVNQSGGSIWCYSEPGMGTTFRIFFPRVSEDAEADSAPAVQPSGGTETILLVEDDDLVRGLAFDLLAARGYRVLAARNASEATEICRREGGSIQLLMTDVVMPGMNGRQLAETLAPEHPEMRVLFTSGYTNDILEGRAGFKGCASLLEKPYTLLALTAAVRNVLDARSPSHTLADLNRS